MSKKLLHAYDSEQRNDAGYVVDFLVRFNILKKNERLFC